MKTRLPFWNHRLRAGFSLIEISLVLALIISLCVGMGIGISNMQRWKKGKNASVALQAVYAAQRAYMADHPTADIAEVSSAQIESYLPQGWPSIPTVTGLSGEALSVDFGVMPARLVHGGATYDPSGKSDDGLWDVGE
jgi:prepilin-type N-terminal cleavage/methylation domain-containing protein